MFNLSRIVFSYSATKTALWLYRKLEARIDNQVFRTEDAEDTEELLEVGGWMLEEQ